MHRVPGAQRPAIETADSAERKGRRGAHRDRHIDAPRHQQVRADATLDTTDTQRLPALDIESRPGRHRRIVEIGYAGRASDHACGSGIEGQLRTLDNDLQARRVRRVAEQTVAEPKREIVHRTRRRDADVPVSLPSGPGLHRGGRAALKHIEARRRVVELLQAGRGHLGLAECREIERLTKVIQIGFDAVYAAIAQRRRERVEGLLPRSRVADEFRQHGVEVRRDAGAGPQPCIDPQTAPFGKCGVCDVARGWPELVVRIFCIDPRLHRVSRRPGRYQVREGWQFVRRQAQHPLHQVHAVDAFRHAVLHLQPGVHFEEVEAPGGGIVEKLNGARHAVPDTCEECAGLPVQFFAHGRRQVRRRTFLDYFLVPPLEGAVPVSDDEHVAATVAERLHLDVARRGDQCFQVQVVVAEVGGRQASDTVERLFQFGRPIRATHADAAAAGSALQHHWITDAIGRNHGILHAREQLAAGQEMHAGARSNRARFVFQAETPELFRRRPDEDDAALGETLGEPRVLAQEAVPRMQGLSTRALDDLEQPGLAHVGVGRAAVAQRKGFVHRGQMQ